MDYLRSCYTTRAKLIAGSDHESDLIWYWADPLALEVQQHHVYGSLTWWDNNSYAQEGVGEIPGSTRVWRNGSIPTPYPSMVRDGTYREWVNGAEAGNGPIERSDFGIPIACLPYGTLPGPYSGHKWRISTGSTPGTIDCVWTGSTWFDSETVGGDQWQPTITNGATSPGTAPVSMSIVFLTGMGTFTTLYYADIVSTSPYQVKFVRYSGTFGPGFIDGYYLPYP